MIVTTVSRMLQGRSSATQAASPQPPPAGPMEAEPETKVLDRESATKDKPALVPASLGVGTTVGRYELIHRLGQGGMAAVFLGRATGRAGFEKLVAVKVIHPHLAAEPDFVEMFLDEARIAARLHHPHVVEILDLDEDEDASFMVMEYVEGETLASLLRQLRKQGERLPLVADACEGLAAAHDLTDADGRPMHLVHRDVSPHNLLVSMDGRVKVVDFGIAKATGRRSSTRTGQLRGKLAYMSPEQASSGAIDHRTDLFALGAVLWELLVNERLFTAVSES
jgi:serine/threonine protein kinase